MSTIPIHGTVRPNIEQEHLDYVIATLFLLREHQNTLERWGHHAAEISLLIADGEELKTRIQQAAVERIDRFPSQGEWVAA